jgi:CRP-like cAMP-binding protein
VVVIDSGHVKIEADHAAGAIAVLGVRGPGDLVGEFAVVTEGIRSASVIALGRVSGYALDGQTFLQIIGQDTAGVFAFTRTVIDKLREADRRRAEYGSLTVARRVVRMLVELADGDCRSGSGELTIPLSQQDLAAAVGASREACAKAIRSVRIAGIVDTGLRAITVLDLERLRSLGDTLAQSGGRRVRSLPVAEGCVPQNGAYNPH